VKGNDSFRDCNIRQKTSLKNAKAFKGKNGRFTRKMRRSSLRGKGPYPTVFKGGSRCDAIFRDVMLALVAESQVAGTAAAAASNCFLANE
jgi:hypothetical protein